MNKNIDVLEEFKNSIAELSRIVEETAQAITLSLEPSREFFISITERGPWILCEMAIEAAEEGETGDLDWFCQEYLRLKPGEWPYAEEALRESIKNLRASEQPLQQPLHYIEKTSHKKKTWDRLDVDHVSQGRFYPGSLFRKRKDQHNKSPRDILSLDVVLDGIIDQEGKMREKDKELWLENDGMLDNAFGGYRVTGEKGSKYEIKDPDSAIKGVDDNEDDVIARVDIGLAIRKAYLIIGKAGSKNENDDVQVAITWGLRPHEKEFQGAPWNQYRPGPFQVHMTDKDIVVYLYWKSPGLKNRRFNENFKKLLKVAPIAKPGKIIFENGSYVIIQHKDYKEGYLKNNTTADIIESWINDRYAILDINRVNASMKRIKRAVKNKTLVRWERFYHGESAELPKRVCKTRWPEMEKLYNY